MRDVAGRSPGEGVQRRALAAVEAVLPPSAEVRVEPADSGVDIVINGVAFGIKWRRAGGLRQARELAAHPHQVPLVVVAPRLSPAARQVLSDAGIGWVDETGAAEIVHGSLVVARDGRPLQPAERRQRWTRSVLATAEALLCGTRPTVAAIQEATELSVGACTKALRILTDMGHLLAEAPRGPTSARRVQDPDALLDAYADGATYMAPKLRLQLGVTWQDPTQGLIETARAWGSRAVAWGATGAVAANVMAPYLTSVNTADVYVDANTTSGLHAVAHAAGLRPMDGGRLTLRPFPTATARRLIKEVSGLRVAPWPRVYADLRTAGVRGEEAAEHLREVVRGR